MIYNRKTNFLKRSIELEDLSDHVVLVEKTDI